MKQKVQRMPRQMHDLMEMRQEHPPHSQWRRYKQKSHLYIIHRLLALCLKLICRCARNDLRLWICSTCKTDQVSFVTFHVNVNSSISSFLLSAKHPITSSEYLSISTEVTPNVYTYLLQYFDFTHFLNDYEHFFWLCYQTSLLLLLIVLRQRLNILNF